MKKQILFLAAMFITSSASAELAWIKTKFWQAPYPKTQILKIQSMDGDLEQTCHLYKKLVYYNGLGTKLNAEEMQFMRTYTGSIHDNQFKAKFKISKFASQGWIGKSVKLANEQAGKSEPNNILPYYTASTATIYPAVLQENLAVKNDPSSFTSLSQSVGLSPLPIRIIGSDLSAIIEVTGKDTACDLYLGFARLSTTGRAIVKITDDSLKPLRSFYKEFEDLSAEALSKKSSSPARAALLGYAMQPVLESLGQAEEISETWLGNLVEQFFDENMNRNKTWESHETALRLNVPVSAIAPLQITLEN
jgi:hypothetical protein